MIASSAPSPAKNSFKISPWDRIPLELHAPMNRSIPLAQLSNSADGQFTTTWALLSWNILSSSSQRGQLTYWNLHVLGRLFPSPTSAAVNLYVISADLIIYDI